jgi:hypothetical protein
LKKNQLKMPDGFSGEHEYTIAHSHWRHVDLVRGYHQMFHELPQQAGDHHANQRSADRTDRVTT